MSDILTIDFKSKDAPTNFVKSLSSSGFAVIQNHGIDSELIIKTYQDWKLFFESDVKHRYLFDMEKQDGYFPFKSENAQGSSTKDLKEFYHIYRWGRYPKELSVATKKTHDSLMKLGSKLLDYLDDYFFDKSTFVLEPQRPLSTCFGFKAVELFLKRPASFISLNLMYCSTNQDPWRHILSFSSLSKK